MSNPYLNITNINYFEMCGLLPIKPFGSSPFSAGSVSLTSTLVWHHKLSSNLNKKHFINAYFYILNVTEYIQEKRKINLIVIMHHSSALQN